jgi:predicted HTH transcriptional regulator
MQDLFDAIVAGGEAAVLDLIARREQETVTLEFKTKADASVGRLDKGDKRNLGKTVSAFANSQGGLQIWGIYAKREPGDDVDCAREAKPIADIERLKSDVITLTGEILAPRHDGIVVEAIPSSNTPGTGFLLVRVNRSERRPHMSRAPDDGRYYRRAGGATFPMEHGDIEDAFNRRRVAALSVVHEWREGGTISTGGKLTRNFKLVE